MDQGPSENRIDLTMVGDGYTESQKEQFFQDAQRLTDDLFEGQTFASYLPLFNVHAVFVPSKDSGITNLEKKNTALGLYRSPAGSARVIDVRKPAQARKAIALAKDTDYPILIANDPLYGGLGGEFAITTNSKESGSVVLRHELGHNFGDVGEEYDGGEVYTGANHSRKKDVKWSHWTEGPVEPEKARVVLAEYPWKNLEKGEQKFEFQVKPLEGRGSTPQVGLLLSSVGWESPEDVQVQLDGKPVPLEGVYTNDRSFFSTPQAFDIAPGPHQLTIKENIKDHDNVLGSVQVTTYAQDYNFDPNHIGAYPTFNSDLKLVGYRPTDHSCLMRDMRQTEFCPIDKENMWQKFLHTVSLIDDVETKTLRGGDTQLLLKTPNLKGLEISWFRVDKNGKQHELEEFQGKKKIRIPADQQGSIQAQVSFQTPEVRQYTPDFVATKTIQLS